MAEQLDSKKSKTHELELDGAALRGLVGAVLDRLGPWLDGLPQQPTSKLDGGHKLAAALREPMPEAGTPYRRILGQLFERIIPASLNPASPGYLAYIPGGGLPHAAVADLISGVVNRYTGLWVPAPGLVQIEVNVLRWMCGLVGYGPDAGGVLCSGGSMANLGAVVAAREDRLGPDFLDGVIYTSQQAHHSVLKAARVAGFSAKNVVELPVDERYRLRVDALQEAVAADRAAGRRPFLVVGHAGSTAAGAVDPLEEIGAIAAAEGLWFHVDAAYGGFFLLTERGKSTLAGIQRADSVALDPHKGLFLPYGTGALVVRDRLALKRAFTVGASYLPPAAEGEDCWDFADYGPELTRPGRGLRVWLPLMMHGVAAFRTQLDEKLDLAADAARRIEALPGVRMFCQPALSLFAFDVGRDGLTEAERDGFTRRVLSRINQRQRVLLSGVDLKPPVGPETFAIRVAILSFRTHADRIDALVEDVRAAIADGRG